MGSARDDGSGLDSRMRDISRRLARRFGEPDLCGHEISPVRNLVLTILSQNTTDANRDRAFESLMRRFPTFPRLAAAKPAEVEEAIRVGGLAKAKGAAILSALSRLKKERGDYTLGFLQSMPLPDARAYLTSFKGVGVKTANIILLFSFGLPAFPVDTHILRVTKRLGLVPGTADLAKAALALEPHVPAGKQMPLHLNLIRLGRELCRPRNPLCVECPLLAACPEGARIVKETGGHA
jgi:endonuclease-3